MKQLKVILICAAAVVSSMACVASMLFPSDTPMREFATFKSEGFSKPAVGVIYDNGGMRRHGVPLGGIGTGYINLDLDGTLGEWTIFNNLVNPKFAKKVEFMPQPVPVPRDVGAPFLGLAVDGKTTVLSVRQIPEVSRARTMRYWGHYPVADLEYDLVGPVSVGLRAWSPFVLGDSAASNTPVAVFEVQVRNTGSSARKCTLVVSFPGPADYETNGKADFTRRNVEGDFTGVLVSTLRPGWPAPELPASAPYGYALGVIGPAKVRTGGALGADGSAWNNVSTALPDLKPEDTGASAAMDFDLAPNETKVVRFVLAWYAPFWPASPYINMYRQRFKSPLEVANYLAAEHDKLLSRVLAWQQAIYGERKLPDYVRDELVNCLNTMTKGGSYVQNPGADAKGGLLSIWEAAGQIQLQETNCVSWWGDFPITYFFPDLRLTTLRAFAAYQLDDGKVPFFLGSQDNRLDAPNFYAQYVVNGMLYTQMVERYLERTRDEKLLREFYPVIKKATQFGMSLSLYKDGLITIDPEYPKGQPWDGSHWRGNAPYIAGQWLCSLEIAERMAEKVGDTRFATQCRDWIKRGSVSLEKTLWNEQTGCYLMYNAPGTNYRCDSVFSYQLDGAFSTAFFGLPPVFPEDRLKSSLATIKRLCVVPVKVGAANCMKPDGSIEGLGASDTIGFWPSANVILAANYAYHGDRATAEEILRKMIGNLALARQLQWDFPQGFTELDGVTPRAGDYYWGMAVWAAPPALLGQDVRKFCGPGGFVDRILKSCN